ncbi:hypothetical protein BBK82_20955 [Lentzea guizhouensis]|uniref:Uncharacterized protein n=2 Tax=Lentzea guizhouensis TaxID=1586287 RepID=A0A1B2HKB4_9PSEU|nr:hypothetical protein BBK82_20955 [Lentzea guizhouensis]
MLQLAHVLAALPGAGLQWRVEEFEGFGPAVGALPAADRERLFDGDHRFASWEALTSFAAGLEQTIWCTLVGARDGRDEITVIAFDSSEWEVRVPDELAGAVRAVLEG